MVHVENLVKQYGDHYAVDHLSFDVQKGQVLGFLGPNGAGKSTTMNIITGYISATEGTVTIDGHDILEEPEEAKKSIGYLPEQPPLYPEMTVYEYLDFVGEIKGVPKKERPAQIEKVLELTKTTSYRNRLTKFLSKGYRQRTGIAGAMIGNPEVIILDEPTVGLDPTQIIEVRDLIRNLAAEHTVILSSHIMQEIAAVCDDVLIIHKGRLVVHDTPQNLEKQLSSTSTVEICAKADRETLEKIVGTIPNLLNHQIEEPDADGITKLHLFASEGADPREDAFRAFAKADCPMLEMRLKEVTLEDVFLTVTKRADESEAEAAAAADGGKPVDGGKKPADDKKPAADGEKSAEDSGRPAADSTEPAADTKKEES